MMNPSILLFMLSMMLILLFTVYQCIYILLNKKTSVFFKCVAIVVLVATLFVGSRRSTYLPFLGRTVLPVSLLKDVSDVKSGDVSVKVPVNAPDNTRVIYWASKSAKSVVKTPAEAYGDFKNSGVALVKDNMATFHIACPSSYNVPYTTLLPHVHYRVSLPQGLLSDVKTLHVECGKK